MRVSPIRDALLALGPTFSERVGVEVVATFAEPRIEYHRVRDAVGITDFSHTQVYRAPEETGVDFLDSLVAGNVAKVRYGRVLHTFLADADGMLLADCYVANNDEELLVVCESIVDDAAMDGFFLGKAGSEAGVEKLSGESAVLGIDGYKAWAVAKALFGPDVLGLPYLSVEMYSFEGEQVRLIRAGKTSEFGYQLIVPATKAAALLAALLVEAEKHGGGMCGVDIHDCLRLDGRFFNVYAEGARVKDPLVLGLQWMADFDKEQFLGGDALRERRSQGLARKIVGIRTAAGSEPVLQVGSVVVDDGADVAEVAASCRSHVLDADVGLAVFPVELAYSGLTFHLNTADGPEVATVSMPPILPKSLTVKLDEL
jgi:glycine cleavage system aminomethyltransferase T